MKRIALVGLIASVAPGPSNPASPVEIPIGQPGDTVGRCEWRAQSSLTDSGGPFAACEAPMFPVTSGVFIEEYDDTEHRGLVVLSPGWWELDGEVSDGSLEEPLTDEHPHGEPPPDGMQTEFFDPDLAATGIHYALSTSTAVHNNDVRTLCCEPLSRKPGIGALTDCHFETALVPFVEETDPDLAGQHVASLACESGFVTSGGCYVQFEHSHTEFSMTGSHPYVGGDPMEMPHGAHSSTPGETGWACRIDREPVGVAEGAFVGKVGITALCCD